MNEDMDDVPAEAARESGRRLATTVRDFNRNMAAFAQGVQEALGRPEDAGRPAFGTAWECAHAEAPLRDLLGEASGDCDEYRIRWQERGTRIMELEKDLADLRGRWFVGAFGGDSGNVCAAHGGDDLLRERNEALKCAELRRSERDDALRHSELLRRELRRRDRDDVLSTATEVDLRNYSLWTTSNAGGIGRTLLTCDRCPGGDLIAGMAGIVPMTEIVRVIDAHETAVHG